MQLESVLEALRKMDCPLSRKVSVSWYRIGKTLESGHREFRGYEQDGYLVRFSQNIGTRQIV